MAIVNCTVHTLGCRHLFELEFGPNIYPRAAHVGPSLIGALSPTAFVSQGSVPLLLWAQKEKDSSTAAASTSKSRTCTGRKRSVPAKKNKREKRWG